MSNDSTIKRQPPLSVVFFGRRCSFTTIPFERLIRAGVDIRALILSSPAPDGPPVRRRNYRPTISMAGANPPIERIAGERDVPLYEVRRPLREELCAVLREYSPDLLVAACFPWRIPPALLSMMRLGGINLHPSPLPRFRGPDPLFWAYRNGERSWGVTVHQLSESFDAGPILAQSSLLIPKQLPGDELERRCATVGGDLLLAVIEQANAGALSGRDQRESDATYQSWPNTEQLMIERDWTVERVCHFVAGVRTLGYEPAIETSQGLRTVVLARTTNQDAIGAETWLDERTILVAFADGVVEFALG